MKVLFYSVAFACFLFFVSCKKDSNNIPIPTVSLDQVTNIRAYSVQIPPCLITNEGNGAMIGHGYCISTSANPDIFYQTTNIIAHNNAGVAHFHFTNLLPNTTYYLRAYASSSSGLSYSNEVSFTTTTTTLALGKDYAGGIVFYIDPSGSHGLVASAFSQFEAPWQNGTASGAAFTTGSAINTGNTNTNTILGIYGPMGDYSATRCDDYNLNNYTDWFLPSKDELDAIRTNLYLTGIADYEYISYWSSTNSAGGGDLAYTLGMANGSSNVQSTTMPAAAIPCRQF